MTGKALVTGATGHLGANLVRRLLADGDAVRALVRPGDDSAALDGLPLERVVGDLRDTNAVSRAVQGCTRVFHTGAIVSTVEGNDEHKRAIFETNVLGTQHVLDAALATGVKRVVVTGSFSAVGYDPDHPSRPSNEEMPFDPFHSPTPYSTSKAAAEQQCWQAAARGLEVVVAVSCAIVGPNDFIPSRLGGVMCSFGRLPFYIPGGFPFVAARDISQGHVLAMNKGRSGERYIFASEFRTMDEIMGMFEEVTGQRRPPIRLSPAAMGAIAQVLDPFVTRFVRPERQRLTPAAVHILRLERHADIGKARRELGYEPTSIAEAVREAYAFYRERGMLRTATRGRPSAGRSTVSLDTGAP
ncbi:MAG TPA: NAD-dependent epimerase/dehydratase family protein [Polyangiaceae bacterium]|jgi:nucleoside-diphosphate-sugar epimerase|nr:NAD-dependent epimerase/dehydratase family protein [Polyangiaceae bacterium]